MLSDRIGRNPGIIRGLWILPRGGGVAALRASIPGLIVGAPWQGSGGIAPPCLPLAPDLTGGGPGQKGREAGQMIVRVECEYRQNQKQSQHAQGINGGE